MKRARTLYRLQTVEADIDQKSRRLREVETLLGNSKAVKAAQSLVDEAEGRLHKAQGETQRLDLENRGLQEEIAATEKHLYSGRVTNPKELASLEDKIKNLKERRVRLEDSLLEAMVEAEEAEAALGEARRNLTSVRAEWEAGQSDLAAERDALSRSLSALCAERDTLRSDVSDSDMEIFEDLCRRKSGRCVVKMVDGTCQGCGVSVPTNVASAVYESDDLIFCGSCERILYV
jgi:predicted  nucleic acid-binding Zn-ribbon protein